MQRFLLTAILLLSGLVNLPAWAGKTVLIDVRTPAEYAQGHLEGALNIEYEKIVAGVQAAKIGTGDHVALYCRSGRRSAIAAKALSDKGFRAVEDLGGMEAAAQKWHPKP